MLKYYKKYSELKLRGVQKMTQYTLRPKTGLQIYGRITENDHVLKKLDGVVSPGRQIVVERGMFGYFAGKDVVALMSPRPKLVVVGTQREPQKLILVEDLGINTRELLEVYRSYVKSKTEASQKPLSISWAKTLDEIGKSLVLGPKEGRMFLGSEAEIIFSTPLKLEFPAA